jgi:predicted glycosyl hydrolase (DUF1957 family)
MITWINFLHIYQPPTQTKEIINKVVDESYRFILDLLRRHPDWRLTMNITGSLLELLDEYGHKDIIDAFKKHWQNGRIELTSSAMYHGFLPLLPVTEIKRQIELNNTILKKYFGEECNPKGFYMPEMAYSKKVADVVKTFGFTWTILDEIHHPAGVTDPGIHYKIKNNGMSVIFRNKIFSKPPVWLLEHMSELKSPYIITGNDGELYGHWHKDDGYFDKALEHQEIKTIQVSEYLNELKTTEYVQVRNASWESQLDELAQKIPYGLWNSPQNKVHRLLWTLAKRVIKIVTASSRDNNFVWARHHLDRGLASCAWWWASNKKFHEFSPITWNPEEIEKGARELLTAVRSLQALPSEEKIKTERLFNKLDLLIWETHWESTKNPS